MKQTEKTPKILYPEYTAKLSRQWVHDLPHLLATMFKARPNTNNVLHCIFLLNDSMNLKATERFSLCLLFWNAQSLEFILLISETIFCSFLVWHITSTHTPKTECMSGTTETSVYVPLLPLLLLIIIIILLFLLLFFYILLSCPPPISPLAWSLVWKHVEHLSWDNCIKLMQSYFWLTAQSVATVGKAIQDPLSLGYSTRMLVQWLSWQVKTWF